MSKIFNERLSCICSQVVKFDSAVFVSRFSDKFDLRTREERVFCRGCEEGKRRASEWLSGRLSLEESGGRTRHREK